MLVCNQFLFNKFLSLLFFQFVVPFVSNAGMVPIPMLFHIVFSNACVCAFYFMHAFHSLLDC